MKVDDNVFGNSPFGYHKLPGDLLIEIALHLGAHQDILNLCLTVRLSLRLCMHSTPLIFAHSLIMFSRVYHRSYTVPLC